MSRVLLLLLPMLLAGCPDDIALRADAIEACAKMCAPKRAFVNVSSCHCDRF